MSEHGAIIKRTVPFVKKVVDRNTEDGEPSLLRASSEEPAEEAPGPESQRAESAAAPTGVEGPRRSERIRNKPAHLRNYVHLLGWNIEREGIE